jgi:hypothetical protein
VIGRRDRPAKLGQRAAAAKRARALPPLRSPCPNNCGVVLCAAADIHPTHPFNAPHHRSLTIARAGIWALAVVWIGVVGVDRGGGARTTISIAARSDITMMHHHLRACWDMRSIKGGCGCCCRSPLPLQWAGGASCIVGHLLAWCMHGTTAAAPLLSLLPPSQGVAS